MVYRLHLSIAMTLDTAKQSLKPMPRLRWLRGCLPPTPPVAYFFRVRSWACAACLIPFAKLADGRFFGWLARYRKPRPRFAVAGI